MTLARTERAHAAPVPLPLPVDLQRGVGFVILGVFLLATMDLLSKLTVSTLSTMQIVWVRYLVQAVLLIAVTGRTSVQRCLATTIPGLHVVRALLLLGGSVAFMFSLRYLSLADANVVGFLSPLLITALSLPVLGMRVRWHHWAAVITGFLGVLVMLRPGGTLTHWAILLPLMSALCSAAYHIMTPIVARTDDPALSIYFTSGIAIVLAGAFMPWSWVAPTAVEWMMLVGIGILGVLGQLLTVRGFVRAPVSVLAPFLYVHLLLAIVYGWIVFHDWPGTTTLIGAALVVGSGIYVYRSRQA